MKTREKSVFGLHFDFFASPQNCPDPIGQNLTEAGIRDIIRTVKPDFFFFFYKGHPGWASYPTECGNGMPEFYGDPLAMWRKVTREENVALYMHYSGVIDQKYCLEHPDQACMKADGTRSAQATRTMGRYVDDLLIPQLKELALRYGVDGVWVDGDCWGSEVDFDPQTVAAFEQETGHSLTGVLPADESHPLYEEYREFCRELFRRYVRKYTDALHEACPGFQVASNWSYTDHMPEPVTADVDFISGDLSPNNAFNSARYAARAIAQQGKTWDLISWNFRSGPDYPLHQPKHPVQIMQEAAAVIALGGGFQNYITQRRDGTPRYFEIMPMAQVGRFVRRRAPYCFRGQAVNQAAVLLSTEDRHRESNGLFSRNGMEKIMGLTCLLCDSGHSTQIVSEHTLEKQMYAWPVIVVPETYAGPARETVDALLDYARRGGSLLLVGQNTCRLFAEAGAPYEIMGEFEGSNYIAIDDEDNDMRFAAAESPVMLLAKDRGDVPAYCYGKGASRVGNAVSTVTACGEGKIAAIGWDLGSEYQKRAQYLYRRLIRLVLDRLYDPMVRLEQVTGLLEIVCLKKSGRHMIQLVNANGSHRDPTVATEDAIPPCLDAVLSIRLNRRPEQFLLQPEGTDLPFTWRDGRALVKVDRVPIHEIIEVR